MSFATYHDTARLRREFAEFEKQELDKQMAPVVELARQNYRLQLAVATEEENVRLNNVRRQIQSTPSPEWLKTVPQADAEGRTGNQVGAAIKAAFEAYKATVEISEEDLALLVRFIKANPGCAIDEVSTWQSAMNFIIKSLTPRDVSKTVGSPAPTHKAAPVAKSEPEPQTYSQAGFQQYTAGFRAAVAELGREMSEADMRRLFNAINGKRFQDWSRNNIRATFFRIFGLTDAATEADKLTYAMDQDEGLSSEAFAKKYGMGHRLGMAQ